MRINTAAAGIAVQRPRQTAGIFCGDKLLFFPGKQRLHRRLEAKVFLRVFKEDHTAFLIAAEDIAIAITVQVADGGVPVCRETIESPAIHLAEQGKTAAFIAIKHPDSTDRV